MLKYCAAVLSDQPASSRPDVFANYRFDRRRGPRRATEGASMAVFSDATGRTLLARVEVFDVSSGGMGLLTSVPVDPGMSVTLHPGTTLTPGAYGLVARCDRIGEVYRVGLRATAVRAA